MKYAIDRFIIGSEAERSADDFDDLVYIPGRRNRFYCPECGEIVYFRAKGGNNPNHFYHREKTDRSPECDRRVDGKSGLSLSQRVGLPVYLTAFVPGQYHLNIGFPALGSEMLEKASMTKHTVEISCENQYRTVKVNPANFIEDETTLIPINFIPKNGNNYTVIISGEKTIYGLSRKWANYADGFDYGGAVFTYGELSGKKVRRGDNISTYRCYYVVTKNVLPNFPNVFQVRVGSLSTGHETYGVYKVEINVSIDDKDTFTAVSKYFKHHFGVWLLECPPELIPIWPPVIQRDYLIPVSGLTSVLCAVSSGNIMPNVYVYSEYGASKKRISHDYNGVKTVDIALGERPITLSVDRKYVGREVSFLSKQIEDSTYEYEISIENERGNIPWINIDSKVLSSEFSFFSNGKMELYTGTKGKAFRHIPIRDSVTIVPAIRKTEELYIVVESAIIHQIKCEDEINESIKEKKIIQRFAIARNSKMVPLPQWADYTIRSLKNSHKSALFETVMSTVKNGKVPLGVLRLLRTIKIDRSE